MFFFLESSLFTWIFICIYMYIYIYIQRERKGKQASKEYLMNTNEEQTWIYYPIFWNFSVSLKLKNIFLKKITSGGHLFIHWVCKLWWLWRLEFLCFFTLFPVFSEQVNVLLDEQYILFLGSHLVNLNHWDCCDALTRACTEMQSCTCRGKKREKDKI